MRIEEAIGFGGVQGQSSPCRWHVLVESSELQTQAGVRGGRRSVAKRLRPQHLCRRRQAGRRGTIAGFV